jgi:hypothetical protein
MNLIQYQIPFLFSSNNNNIIDNGLSNRFKVSLQYPILIPKEAIYCHLQINNSTVWWTIFNIELDVNDSLKVIYFDGVLEVNHTLVLDPGLYDLESLNKEIRRELLFHGLPEDLFDIVPDIATSKAVIEFLYDGVQIDFNIPNSVNSLLGFELDIYPAIYSVENEHIKSPNIANFNSLDYILLHSDIVSRGLLINNKYSNVIEQILINQAPGSQIIQNNENPVRIPCNELIGTKLKDLNFWVTDQLNNEINLQGENFSVRMTLSYFMKI